MKFAILGTGWAADMNARAARRIEGVELDAVYSSDPHRGEKFARRHNTKYIKELQQIIKMPEIEAVIIATTPDKHGPQLEQLLNHKPIIFVEKPFALDAEEAKLMAEKVKESSSSVSVLYKHRFDEAFHIIRKMFKSGNFGKILHVNLSMSQFRDESYMQEHNGWRRMLGRAGGGVLLQQGIHWVNFLFGIFGYEVEVKNAIVFKTKGRLLEDFISIQIEHGIGFIGNMIFSRATATMPVQLEVLGTKASVRYDTYGIHVFHRDYGKESKFIDRLFGKISREFPITIKRQKSLKMGSNSDVIRHVINANMGKQRVSFFMEEAIKDQEFIEEAIKKSSKDMQ